MALTGTTATHTQTAELPEVADPSQVAPRDARWLSGVFFEQMQTLEEGTQEYQHARNTLIEMNMSLVRYAAGRFRSRGPQEAEDIVQVGAIGLIKAIDRFELSREVEFTPSRSLASSARSSGSSVTRLGPCTYRAACRRPGSSWPEPTRNSRPDWAELPR